MEPRFSHTDLNPELYRRMAALNSAVQDCGLDRRLLEPVGDLSPFCTGQLPAAGH